MSGEAILKVRDLRTYFNTDDGVVKAVDGVSFDLHKGETLGIVGESGSGKSVTNLSVMKLIPMPPGKIMGGQAFLDGDDLLIKNEQAMRSIRGKRISMIFQDPMTSLNPFLRISTQMVETIQLHEGSGKKEARKKAIDMLGRVGIPTPEKKIDAYPHQFSGGMRQRVMIAMALSCQPQLLFADEPTTALDVTIQAQILELLKQLKEQLATSIVMITHDLGVIAEMASRVVVMYAGRVVEEAPVGDLFKDPRHPYTRGLLGSIPVVGRRKTQKDRKLQEIEGIVPDLKNLPRGCRFHPRCAEKMPICEEQEPGRIRLGTSREVTCWRENGSQVET